jgi:hypothetical protein
MKAKIQVSVIYNNGKKDKIKHEIDCPDFVERQSNDVHDSQMNVVLAGKQITILSQIDDWYSNIDKRVWMDQHDVFTIQNWKVLSATNESGAKVAVIDKKDKDLSQEQILAFWLQHTEATDQFKKDFLAVYSRMKSLIKNMKFTKQAMITMRAMDIAYDSASNALIDILLYDKMIDTLGVESVRKMKEENPSEFELHKQKFIEEHKSIEIDD